jgi:hypothetical protein
MTDSFRRRGLNNFCRRVNPLLIGVICGELIALPFLLIPRFTYALPPNYYGAAENYVLSKYGAVNNRTIGDLENFLMRIDPFPVARDDVFDCSEASARLEWLLEGAGFDASIAWKQLPQGGHTWVIVYLPDTDNVPLWYRDIIQGNSVSVEATVFLSQAEIAENAYLNSFISLAYLHRCPGFVGGTLYDPEHVFPSPVEAVRAGHDPGDFDWWNAPEYLNVLSPGE